VFSVVPRSWIVTTLGWVSWATARLAAEAFGDGRVAGEVEVEGLDRHVAVENGVAGQHHLAHAAAAQLGSERLASGEEGAFGHGVHCGPAPPHP